MRVLHHRKLGVSQLADLVELAEGRGINPILVLFNALLHKFVGLFAIVTELARECAVARAPVILKLALKESNLYRRKQESLALLDLAGDRVVADILLKEGVWKECIDGLAESEE